MKQFKDPYSSPLWLRNIWTLPFWNFQKTYFTESLSITAEESSTRLLCNGLCNIILYTCKNCCEILWTYSLNIFINDISSKRIKRHLSGLIFISADLVTLTKEIFNEKLHFLYSAWILGTYLLKMNSSQVKAFNFAEAGRLQVY